MSPALHSGDAWSSVPPPKNPGPELGGNSDPGTYEADAGYNDPEPRRAKDWLRLPEGRTFPDPDDPNEVQWRLRYGEPTQADRMFAASALSAYVALVYSTERVRNQIVRDIKAADRG